MRLKLFFIAISALLTASCSRNAITGRNQLQLLPESELQTMAKTEYQTFLSQNKIVSSSVSKDAEMVKRVGNRIAKAITEYYTAENKGDILQGYQWEFNLVDSKDVNAWCMPGGKVVVYTGILPVTQNEAALAVVMGHEIAHAIAQHGNERMSQGLLAEGLGTVGSVLTSGNPTVNNIFNTVYAPGAQIGVLLPNSRKQELEADQYGLIFAAMAGYNPNEAVPFWERMAKAGGGQKPPEFLSTHPSDETRIEKVKRYAEDAMKYYRPVK
ncbi:M48 family metallopeptidase [Agriterribacter sp.]|uniref:M48 family metallopeptidase n=1 Tax=Agriterribacter sp. TaxID=2821509 RepID=UPI002C49A1AB|nr:M48 family metallopeptidase [Agriterribacter sp.]HRP55368.1 M48 family metallopeptidase [Agriterribacter sp.]